MTVLLDPRAEEFRRSAGADELKPIEAVSIDVSILNSRWESMTRIAGIIDEELAQRPDVGRIEHFRIKHSEPTPEGLLDHVARSSHYAILGLGN